MIKMCKVLRESVRKKEGVGERGREEVEADSGERERINMEEEDALILPLAF